MHELPFQTITQFAALGLTLIAGWFLGLASHTGGRKWRERYLDEEMENAGYRDRAESDLRDAARRIRDLEAENSRLKAEAPAPAPSEGHSTAALVGAAAVGAVAGAAAAHAADQQEEPASEQVHPLAEATHAPAEEAHHAPVDDHHPAHADTHQ